MEDKGFRDEPKILNKHPETVIHEKYIDYFKSFAEGSLIAQFAVKTNDFNQCFMGKVEGERYSSITIKKHNGAEIYEVRVNGVDDSSYGKEFASLDEAKKCAEGIKRVSTILLHGHLQKMGFHFTN